MKSDRTRILADLEEQLPRSEEDLATLRGAHLFITGGTGFVGSWLLESLLHANARLSLGTRITVLTRDPEAFQRRAPHFTTNGAVVLVRGDVRTLPPALGVFDGILHAATPASASLNRDRPLDMLDTIVEGGRATLELAARSGAIPFLFTSSGAVYGSRSATARISENDGGGPDVFHPAATYAEGKRLGELQCAIFARAYGIRAKIARLFAFVGPYFPRDRHFAIGNFIGNALAGRPIVVTGDGTTLRSYQYAAEMVRWLWAIYARADPLYPINVGSEEAVSIGELAQIVSESGSLPQKVEICGIPIPGKRPDSYVPDVSRAREHLGLTNAIALRSALARTIESAGGVTNLSPRKHHTPQYT